MHMHDHNLGKNADGQTTPHRADPKPPSGTPLPSRRFVQYLLNPKDSIPTATAFAPIFGMSKHVDSVDPRTPPLTGRGPNRREPDPGNVAAPPHLGGTLSYNRRPPPTLRSGTPESGRRFRGLAAFMNANNVVRSQFWDPQYRSKVLSRELPQHPAISRPIRCQMSPIRGHQVP